MQKTSKAGVIASIVLLVLSVAVIAYAVIAGSAGKDGRYTAVVLEDGPSTQLGSYRATEVSLNLNGASLKIIPSEDERTHVYSSGDLEIGCTESGGYLYVFEERRGYLPWSAQRTGTLTLAIPSLDSVYAHTGSGMITASALTIGDLDMSTISGKVYVSQLDVPGTLYLNSTSGSITGEKIYAEYLSVSTISGDVNMQGCISGDISVDSTSGDISLGIDTETFLYAETTSGAVEIRCEKPVSGYVETTSGDIDITTASQGQSIIVENSYSDVDLVREAEVVENDYDTLYQFGQATDELWIDTISGSLTFR